MARITLTRDECTNGKLPGVCVVCGEDTERIQIRRFSTMPLGIRLWGISAPWACIGIPTVFALLMALQSKTVTAALPVCEQHRGYWLRRRVFLGVVVLSTYANMLGNIVYGDAVFHPYGVFGAMCLSTITMFVVPVLEVRMTRLDGENVTLAGVHPEFVAAVERMREEPDAWPESR